MEREGVPRHPRDGFAALFAVGVVIVLALLSALVLDASLADLRSGRALLAEARASARAESALAAALAIRLDSSVLEVAAGRTVFRAIEVAPDSVSAAMQVLGGGVVRLVVTAVVRIGHFRAIAGRVAYARTTPDPAVPGELSLAPLGPLWWVAVP